MEQLITANMASNMYWLGRHLERVEGSLLEISKIFDEIIDIDKNSGYDLYQKYEIDLEYANAVDFLNQAIFGDHAANLHVVMKNARENAIIARSHIHSDTFGEIIELYNLFDKMNNNLEEIRCKMVDQAFSLLHEIWGSLPKREHNKIGDYFFRLGKLVEEVDFHIRFDRKDEIDGSGMVMYEIYSIIHLLAPKTDLRNFRKKTESIRQEEILNDIYAIIDGIIVD